MPKKKGPKFPPKLYVYMDAENSDYPEFCAYASAEEAANDIGDVELTVGVFELTATETYTRSLVKKS
jgi:hypothetical protein